MIMRRLLGGVLFLSIPRRWSRMISFRMLLSQFSIRVALKVMLILPFII